MNITRKLWSRTFNCSVTCSDTVSVVAVSVFILFLPVVFYLSSFLHSEQKKRKLILRKFLSAVCLNAHLYLKDLGVRGLGVRCRSSYLYAQGRGFSLQRHDAGEQMQMCFRKDVAIVLTCRAISRLCGHAVSKPLPLDSQGYLTLLCSPRFTSLDWIIEFIRTRIFFFLEYCHIAST